MRMSKLHLWGIFKVVSYIKKNLIVKVTLKKKSNRQAVYGSYELSAVGKL